MLCSTFSIFNCRTFQGCQPSTKADSSLCMAFMACLDFEVFGLRMLRVLCSEETEPKETPEKAKETPEKEKGRSVLRSGLFKDPMTH